MIRMNATQARDEFSAILSKVGFAKERVVIQRNGKDLVALIPAEELELLDEAYEARVEQGLVEVAEERGTDGRP